MAKKEASNVTAEQEQIVSGIITKIHKAGGQKAVEAFMESRCTEMPTVKLTKKEMDLLAGGSELVYGIACGIMAAGAIAGVVAVALT